MTDPDDCEYAIYVLYFNLDTHIVARSFQEFAEDVCLGERHLEFVDRKMSGFLPAWDCAAKTR